VTPSRSGAGPWPDAAPDDGTAVGGTATLAVLAVLIVADLALTRGAHRGLRAAAVQSALWVAAALAFGAVPWLSRGPAPAGQYAVIAVGPSREPAPHGRTRR
jgi:hypothetical protein